MVVSFDKLLYLLGDLLIMHLKEYGLPVEPHLRKLGTLHISQEYWTDNGVDHLETVFHPE
jgi:hypothetical protein